MAEFGIVGVYPIVPTRESIAIAARFHNYDWLINASGIFLEEIDWDAFENLALVEVQVFGELSPEDLSSIRQNDQSPYLEFYLDPSGVECLAESDAVSTEGRRVCFYMHFVDTSIPIEIGEQDVELPALSTLPDRLTPFAHYVPVD